MAYGPITSWQINGGKVEAMTDFIFLGSKITADGDCPHEIKRHLLLGRKAMTNIDRDITLPTKVRIVKAMVFPVVMYKCESWTIKKHWKINWSFRTVVLEKTLESVLYSKKIKPVNPRGNKPWIFIGPTEAEALILWTPDAKSQLIGKDPHAGKDWRQEEKEMTENEMVGWHHQLNGHEFEQTQGDGEGQGSLACCSPWGHKESDTTQRLNSNNHLLVSHSPSSKQWTKSVLPPLCSLSAAGAFSPAIISYLGLCNRLSEFPA